MIRALATLAAVPLAAGSVPPSGAAQVAYSAFALEGVVAQGGLLRGAVPKGTVRLTLDGKGVPFAPDRRFVIALDRDAASPATLEAELDGGSVVREVLTVAPRAWRIERLDTLPRISRPSAEFARLRPPELAQIVAARALETDAQGWRQRFIWPATGRISGLFGSQRIYKGEPGAYHSGVDVAGPVGAQVVAPAEGVVILAADHPFTLEGNLLMIDHGMGLNSAFLHLSRIDVRVGQHVRQGDPLGAIGRTGRATGPHLHWAMKWRDVRIDPQPLAGTMAIGR